MSAPGPGGDGHAEGVDLNEAAIETVAALCELGPERARAVVRARPLHDWDDVARLPGFGPGVVRTLQHAGARIGGRGGGGDRPGRTHAE